MLQGLGRLVAATETLSSKFDTHAELLSQANNVTNDIVGILEVTSAKAALINESLRQEVAHHGWWPYIVCPTVSLVMGSYGLPPSAFRNLGLLALGEVVGLLVSFSTAFNGTFTYPRMGAAVNTTALPLGSQF